MMKLLNTVEDKIEVIYNIVQDKKMELTIPLLHDIILFANIEKMNNDGVFFLKDKYFYKGGEIVSGVIDEYIANLIHNSNTKKYKFTIQQRGEQLVIEPKKSKKKNTKEQKNDEANGVLSYCLDIYLNENKRKIYNQYVDMVLREQNIENQDNFISSPIKIRMSEFIPDCNDNKELVKEEEVEMELG